MFSRCNGELKRTLLSALAALIAAAVPSLIPSAALAEAPPGDEAPSAQPAKPPAKRDVKKRKKALAPGKAHKATAKQDPSKAPDVKAEAKDSKGKAIASAKGKMSKKTASRGVNARKKAAKKAAPEAPPRPCLAPPVTLDRMGVEAQTFPLVDCRGVALEAARVELSILARPWGGPRPVMAPAAAPVAVAKGKTKPVAAHLPEAPSGVHLVDKGLISRLGMIARRFPNRTISLVSGFRPQSKGSQHQSARALDLRVLGVSNEELVGFCKTLPDTGCGYYPNSSFVHVDVRNPGTGIVTWIDASGPGESPRYVHLWPEPDIDPVAKLPEAPAPAAVLAQPDAHEDADDLADDDDRSADDKALPNAPANEASGARAGAPDAPIVGAQTIHAHD